MASEDPALLAGQARQQVPFPAESPRQPEVSVSLFLPPLSVLSRAEPGTQVVLFMS